MSSNSNREPNVIAVIGKMHSGKTWLTQRIMEVRKTVLVYNPGKPSDWASYVMIELEVEEGKLYFWYKDNRHPFTDYMKFFRGKHVKCYYDNNDEAEILLFTELSNVKGQRYKGLDFVFDDATRRMKQGKFHGKQEGLVSQAKHAGVNLFLLFHGWGHVPIKGWDFITQLVFFAVEAPVPDKVKAKLKDSPNLKIMDIIHTTISYNAPVHSYARMNMITRRWELFGPSGTTFKLKNMEYKKHLDKIGAFMPFIEIVINKHIKKILEEVIEQNGVDSQKTYCVVDFGEEVKSVVKFEKKVLLDQVKKAEEAAKEIIEGLESPEGKAVIPSAVNGMLSMLGIQLFDIITIDFLTALFRGELFVYRSVYVRLSKGKVVYAVREDTRLKPIKMIDLWKT